MQNDLFQSPGISDPSNYRPISLLSIVSELLEKIVYTILWDHLLEHADPSRGPMLLVCVILSFLSDIFLFNKFVFASFSGGSHQPAIYHGGGQ